MAEQQDNAKLSGLYMDEPRLNFPLPREIRDQIYGYLLEGKYCRVQRRSKEYSGDGLVAYKFHTNLLAVNHAVRSEAEELLYDRNIFIVITVQWPEPQKPMGGLIWVPIVSKTHVKSMSRHTARIHMCAGSDALAASHIETGIKPPMRAFILLADDLESFCLTAATEVSSLNGPVVKVARASNPATEPTIELGGFNVKPARFQCELRDTEYRLMDRSTQHRILASFASIIGGNQRVSFKGRICDEEQIAHLMLIMSPALMCTSACLYATMLFHVQAKLLANAALEPDELGFALELYAIIIDRFSDIFGSETMHNYVQAAAPQTTAMMYTTCLEVALSIAIVKLKLNGFESCAEVYYEAASMIKTMESPVSQSWRIPAGAEAYLHIAELWCAIYGHASLKFPEKTVRQAIDELTAHDHGPHQAYDRELLMRYHNQKAIITEEILPSHQCSLSQLPFLGVPSDDDIDQLTQQGGFSGWQDIELLRSLNDTDRALINQGQKEHGLRITDFSQI